MPRARVHEVRRQAQDDCGEGKLRDAQDDREEAGEDHCGGD